ncbi:arylamine N-acetyltransferase family protein [Caulobacter sp. KR2-114]|uniref:arylamine N-acetyltransferase family protein n=1 Tax=Caulobacter sp. KR2-114 TaxID=3400912 RepID=UPI003BFF0885
MDLEAYFARVGYAGPGRPMLETLQTLHRLHPAAIPFETLDVWLGRPVRLEPHAVDAKLIHGRRGGYCFEQNSLFLRVLRAIGFEAEPLIARSRWNRSPDDVQARTHMALRVRADGAWWLADVGFGGCMQTAPLRLDARGPQQTAFEPRRLVGRGRELRQEVLIGDAWRPVCDLVAAPQAMADIECANWFISTHPSSAFRRHIVVARTLIDARYVLTDNHLAVRRPGQATQLRRLDADGLQRSLVEDFGLRPDPGWRPMIEAIASA